MSKDAYYFSHDANAHTDPKILKLRMSLGWEGYGIYWAIIENLRCQENYSICESEFMFLTLSLAIDEAKLKQVLSKCLEVNLLEVVDSKVLSPSLLKRMEKADRIRKVRREIGAKGGKAKAIGIAKAKAIGVAKDKQTSSIKGKERKVKETKEDLTLPEWISKDSWDGFVEMRNKLKKPLTNRASNGIIKKLSDLGKSKANAILDQSTEHCWQTVYELKQNNSNNNDSDNIFTALLKKG